MTDTNEIKIQLTDELLDECYKLYPIHSAQEIKLMLLNYVGNAIDDIIINNAMTHDINFLTEELKHIKPQLSFTVEELWQIALKVKKYIIEHRLVFEINKEFIDEILYKENIPDESIFTFYDMMSIIFIDLQHNSNAQLKIYGDTGLEIINSLRKTRMLTII